MANEKLDADLRALLGEAGHQVVDPDTDVNSVRQIHPSEEALTRPLRETEPHIAPQGQLPSWLKGRKTIMEQKTEVDSGKIDDPTISEILKRVDDEELREDVFLHAVSLELQRQRERLHHRADMMRRRAAEFDAYADDLEKREEDVKSYIFRLINHLTDVNGLLEAHAHIEPTKVTNGEK